MRAEGKRLPGSFGSAYMYAVVPNTFLFREEHSRRVLVPKVEFASARGNPAGLLTGMALFSWQKARRRFRLESVHPGGAAADVRANTGFDYDNPDCREVTAVHSAEELARLRGPVRDLIAADYPGFAARVWP